MSVNNTEKRLRYFDGLFLRAQDFNDEQAYHIDRQRRHNRLFHKAGIADGLDVKWVDAENKLEVEPGTALDGQGRLIVLQNPQESAQATLKKNYASQTITMVIAYSEMDSTDAGDAQVTDNKSTPKRTHEKPRISLLTPGTNPTPDQIPLAKLQIDADGKVTNIDQSVRTRAGTISDPVTPTSPQVVDTIPGNFTVNGNLRVGGDIDYGGGLKVKGLPAVGFAEKVTADIEIADLNKWQTIPDLTCKVSPQNPTIALCQYTLNIQPGDHAPAENPKYTVKPGDSGARIAAQQLGDEGREQEIRDLNKIKPGESFQPNQEIILPLKDKTQAKSLGNDYVAVRIAVDGKPYAESGTHFRPLADPIAANVSLNGAVLVSLTPGDHNVEVQWFKAGDAVKSWKCATVSAGDGDSKGFISGRSLSVIALANS
jgi:hypothetical protein